MEFKERCQKLENYIDSVLPKLNEITQSKTSLHSKSRLYFNKTHVYLHLSWQNKEIYHISISFQYNVNFQFNVTYIQGIDKNYYKYLEFGNDFYTKDDKEIDNLIKLYKLHTNKIIDFEISKSQNTDYINLLQQKKDIESKLKNFN